MQTVAIVGVGLIGASFGLAIRKAGFDGAIVGVSSPSAIEAGVASGAITAGVTLKQAADQADLIYLSQPVDRILETLGWLGPMARKDTLITDAGSTKTAIVDQAKRHLQYAPFIGGHPMAGRETRGAQSADADLFRARPYVLTSPLNTVPAEFAQLLRTIGANIVEMTPQDHDATVALTSHLPQLISTALAAFLARQDNSHIPQVFGSGLVDMTRLALSPPELWESILATNDTNVGIALTYFANSLLDFRDKLQTHDLARTFTAAAAFATSLRKVTY